jgi:hypothetical protein
MRSLWRESAKCPKALASDLIHMKLKESDKMDTTKRIGDSVLFVY